MKTVPLALIQQKVTSDLKENTSRGLAAFEEAAAQGAKIICYPELAFSPFYPQQPAADSVLDLAETIPGPTTDAFSELARKWGAVAVLNLFERQDRRTFDSSPVIDADGSLLGVTRMMHIMEGPCFHERGYYSPGTETNVYNTRYCRIGVAICYDRHFPEYLRRLSLLEAQLVVVPQAGSVGEWPSGLYEAELQVAAFQNGYFTALCNRVGKESHLIFEGKSFVASPDGQLVAQASELEDVLLICDIDLDQIESSHAKRHFLLDRRPDIYSNWFGKTPAEKP